MAEHEKAKPAKPAKPETKSTVTGHGELGGKRVAPAISHQAKGFKKVGPNAFVELLPGDDE